ncbi:MAG TPA: type II toxin-antitoxin system RelE/ParE family toxin [Azonexus sp.]|nr:type II toxin-antitoxin system RelE/ParE family toxin [Azonexus sp.]
MGILGRDTASTRETVEDAIGRPRLGPGHRGHGHPGIPSAPVEGADRGRWSVWVNGNWRLTFEFRDGQPYVLDYEDYH